MKYIFNANGKCIASCDCEPSLEDLASRGEVVVESEKTYQLSEIELVNGVIAKITTLVTPSEQLADDKLSKLSSIALWTKTAIISGFTSDASGSNVTYDSDEATQLTMQTMYAASQSSDFTTNSTYQGHIPVRGYAEDSTEKTVFNLDTAQVQKFMDDLALHIGTCKKHGCSGRRRSNIRERGRITCRTCCYHMVLNSRGYRDSGSNIRECCRTPCRT